MASFNRVILMGNLTRDVEVKYLPSGTAVAEIGLAVNEKRKDQKTGQMVEHVTFVDITLWERNAEIAAEYLSKGSPILVEGRLKLDTWESEGQKRSKLKVVAEGFRMLGTKGGGGGGGGRGQSGGAPQYDESEFSGSSEDAGPRRNAPARAATTAAPPPDDEIPF
jgi:single-strand DNA-binding protein